MCLTGEEDIKDKEDIKGPEKRYLSESWHAVTNGAAIWQKYHLSEEQVCNVCKLCNKCKPLELCKLHKLFHHHKVAIASSMQKCHLFD